MNSIEPSALITDARHEANPCQKSCEKGDSSDGKKARVGHPRNNPEPMESMSLSKLRTEMQLTQVQVGKVLNLQQAQISRVESKRDMNLSSLEQYIKALGGEIEIFANVKGKRIKIELTNTIGMKKPRKTKI